MERSDKIRQPQVAGQFYPSSSQGLKNQIEAFIDKQAQKFDVIACMLPHAGYIYSGSVAAQTVSRINIKNKVILLGPNHTGYGVRYSIMPEGTWQTPLGEIRIDSNLAGEILNRSKYMEPDNEAHRYEHSLEVELPFLQYFKTDFEIVPIVFLSDEFEILKEIGEEIANTVKERNIKDSTMIVASSDMTHYESQDQAQKKDKEAIQAILELNETKLMDRIRRLNISMCGYAPVITMISAAKLLGAKAAKLIKYQTSGDVTGDKSSVVGYAGIIVY
ncbi:MAG: AmmeMemoRadiSam system protein B [Candidatus Omnitrophota bacterium]|nr:AmmeMemoRadiSam system protein B [Candidatus Omnitrophota bacterium]